MTVTYLREDTKIRRVYMEECYLCESPIALPAGLYTQAKNKGITFYCPFGHSQVYVVPENERLRKELAESQQLANRYSQAFQEERGKRQSLEKEAVKVAKRLQSGVCPKCHRTFQQVARHMASKHGAGVST